MNSQGFSREARGLLAGGLAEKLRSLLSGKQSSLNAATPSTYGESSVRRDNAMAWDNNCQFIATADLFHVRGRCRRRANQLRDGGGGEGLAWRAQPERSPDHLFKISSSNVERQIWLLEWVLNESKNSPHDVLLSFLDRLNVGPREVASQFVRQLCHFFSEVDAADALAIDGNQGDAHRGFSQVKSDLIVHGALFR